MLLMPVLLVQALSSCSLIDEPETGNDDRVAASLALSLTETSRPLTRMAMPEVLSTGSRAIQDLRVVPFARRGEIVSGDTPRYYEGSVSPVYGDKEEEKKRFFYSNLYSFMPGVASFLVYGRAETVKKSDGTTIDKPANGSLLIYDNGKQLSTIPSMVIPANLTLKPEPIYDPALVNGHIAAPDEAECIAAYLTAIANVYGKVGNQTVLWRNTDDSWLKTLYLNFINQGNEKTNVLAGSARNVKAYVNKLYQAMAASTFAEGTMEKAIAEAVMDKIMNVSDKYTTNNTSLKVTVDTEGETKTVTSLGDCDGYPNNRNLPDGAAVLLWGKKSDTTYGFIPQTETNTLASINSINRYAYPAEVYYYGNSLIKTNNSAVSPSEYENKSSWNEILALYYYDEIPISTSTEAVAIKEPLQYGVARLSAKVYATSDALPDANGKNVTVGTSSFPITGIIVDKQRPVGFDFKPLSKEEVDVKFIYDSRLNTNTNDAYYCLSTTDATEPFLHTLVLQNWEDEDVTVILEFENNSGEDFKGENGVVYQGTKFYLVGKITKPTYTESDPDYKKRIFTKDHTTTIGTTDNVGMKVSSLAHAYNVLPDILGGRLEVGVQINMDWEAAEPTTIIFN